ncbi:class I SAM-dependent methyltransferase [Rhodobacteraceae bacterium]|nr:class I SAM-dependent methyltransferase [Paracoccaceae bacterium]
MTHPRISLALETAPLPVEGTILVIGADQDTDLGDLPQDRLELVQGFAPDHDALSARGFAMRANGTAADARYAAAVVFLPRSKQLARNWLAQACNQVVQGGPVWVDGAKSNGVDSIIKGLKREVEITPPIAKAHGKIFCFEAASGRLDAQVLDRYTPEPGFVTVPGVFSAEKVDAGSRLLAAALPDHLPPRMADLGAGWGWLSAQVLARDGVEALDLIEADRAALDCAELNITDPRARFVWADATRHMPESRYGGIVMNPPFHVSRAGDPGLGVAFIRAAASMLSLSGRMWMVANRHLPYEAALNTVFHSVRELDGDGQFKLFVAEKPVSKGQQSARAARQGR